MIDNQTWTICEIYFCLPTPQIKLSQLYYENLLRNPPYGQNLIV